MDKSYLLFSIVLCNLFSTYGYELKQVIILSRHNVRAPLSSDLENYSPKSWPRWHTKPGELTEKGTILEGYMGQYFSLWLQHKGLLKTKNCPTEREFFAYANNKQRTIASAEAFVQKAFPNCNISVHHATGHNKDPNFNPVINNSTDAFKEIAQHEMNNRLSEINVRSSLDKLQSILDYGHSSNCKSKNQCDLAADKTTIELEVGLEPELIGPLHIANSVVDSFKMAYYEGFPIENIAWDEIKKSKDWENLMAINFAYHDVRFNTSSVAKDIATPLITYMRIIFENEYEYPKITLLMGHDANLYTVLSSFNFKSFKLGKQFEKTPVGGKLVFQKWWDDKLKRALLKIEYIYQSTEQLREEIELCWVTPPQTLTMELKNCVLDENGFCLWEDFIKILDDF